MESNDPIDLAVIGGGLAGLAAAALAARGGAKVRLFERARTLGGRAATQEKEGFSLNLGPHALYRGAAGAEVLATLDIRPRGAPAPTTGGHAICGGVKHVLPAGLRSLLSTRLLGAGGKLETARLLARLASIDPLPLAGVPVSEGLARLTRHGAVRQLLEALFRLSTYGNAPRLQSAGAALEQLQRALSRGVLYLDGGWQQLVDALRESAIAAGVTIETGVRACRIDISAAGAVSAVRLADGRIVRCNTAIVTGSPDDALAALGPATPASGTSAGEPSGPSPHAVIETWARAVVPVRAACLDVALRRLPSVHSNFALGIDAPLYLSVHSAVARLAPAGAALLHVARYLDPSEPENPVRDRQELERLLDLVQPTWREQVVHQRFLPSLTVAHAHVTAAQGGTAGRPGPAVPGVRGLFVAGDWVGPEGLLADAALASARRAVELWRGEGAEVGLLSRAAT